MPAKPGTPGRAISDANLLRNGAVTHGAYSGELIREATREHLANLSAQLPNASREELTVQAVRMAQIERLTAYVEAKGLIRNQRQGTVFAAADLLAKLSTQFERQHALLLDRERANGDAGDDLNAYLAELEEARDGD
jgi:hypothetical protein